MIHFFERRKLWVLEMEETAYAFGLDSAGGLEHTYWGPKLPFLQDYPVPSVVKERSSFDARVPSYVAEYLPWHGLSYEEPTLKVDFADGTRDLVPVYQSYQIVDHDHLILYLQDPKGVQIELHYELNEAQDLLTRYQRITNTGEEPVFLQQALSAVWGLPIGQGYRMTNVSGEWIREFQLHRSVLTEGKKVVESRKGHTGHVSNPFFFVDANGAATEQTGDVWFGVLGYSGNWKIVHELTSYGRLLVSGGIHDFDFSWKLGSGKSFLTPEFAAGYSNSGFGKASRNLHEYIRSSVLPETTKEQALPVLYNSWEATAFHVSAEEQMKLAEKAADLGVELFVIDDGWFGERNSDKAGLGDWWVNPSKFPHGLTPVIEKCEQLGMKFGIWVEPEMVNKDSELYRSHPDWVYHFADRDRTEARNQLVLNFAREDVLQYVMKKLDDLLANHNISYLKWDMNRSFSEPGFPDFPKDQAQEIWVRHVEGIYRVMKHIRDRYPHVSIESCSGGGGRVDLGVLRFADQFWPSDNTDAYDRLAIQEGSTYVYPAKAMRAWVTDVPQFVNGRTTPLKYRFHSAMAGALGIGGNISEWSQEELLEAQRLIAIYKNHRDLVAFGDLYRLHSPTFGTENNQRGARPGDWSAVQYVSKDQTDSICFILGRGIQYADLTPVFKMQGLKPEGRYKLEVLDSNRENGLSLPQELLKALDGKIQSGLAWQTVGVQTWLRGDYPSMVLRFIEV